ncbi:MAG: fatty acid CoA ligase family protein [Gemmataceae bacterium]|jgi:acyl-CoA synthetase (AMP-forming)/AMP-acid ligase II|nr:fatty acid CoA ligase family protein [Gemmataceae bacterium]
MNLTDLNVSIHLTRLAQKEPHRPAIHYPVAGEYQTIHFAELDLLSSQIAAGLLKAGFHRGLRTVLMVPPSREFFALTFALFKAGIVPVMIDPGMGIRNLGKCLLQARPTGFIGISKAHLARKILGWGKPFIEKTVTLGSRLWGGQFTLKQIIELGSGQPLAEPIVPDADETAAILFTSGSTGIAKGVVYPHRIFAAQVELLKQVYGIEPGEIDLSTFPLFALFAPALGMTAVVPDMDPTRPAEVNPEKILRAIERYSVTNLFGSPALINRLARYAQGRSITLPTLRRVLSAGAPVPAKVIEKFVRMLPEGVPLYTPYGATEALPVANMSSPEILTETRYQTEQGKGVCIGRPVPHIRVAIIPISDQPIPHYSAEMNLPVGEIGELAVSGPIVTSEYFDKPEATALAKMHEADGTLWHRMGDCGYFDEQGRLWFCGRKSQRVILEDETLFTICCEGIFNTITGIYRTALVGVSSQGKTEPVICVELESDCPRSWSEIEKQLKEQAQKHPQTRRIQKFLRHPQFPVDIRHNAKIFREKLAAWASRKLAS